MEKPAPHDGLRCQQIGLTHSELLGADVAGEGTEVIAQFAEEPKQDCAENELDGSTGEDE